jgi:hypothetical protein
MAGEGRGVEGHGDEEGGGGTGCGGSARWIDEAWGMVCETAQGRGYSL